MIDMIDSLIFLIQRKSRIYYKYGSVVCIATAGGMERCNWCISWKVWYYFVVSQVFRVPFDRNKHVDTCREIFFMSHRHGFLMSTTCRHNCMSMTALLHDGWKRPYSSLWHPWGLCIFCSAIIWEWGHCCIQLAELCCQKWGRGGWMLVMLKVLCRSHRLLDAETLTQDGIRVWKICGRVLVLK